MLGCTNTAYALGIFLVAFFGRSQSEGTFSPLWFCTFQKLNGRCVVPHQIVVILQVNKLYKVHISYTLVQLVGMWRDYFPCSWERKQWQWTRDEGFWLLILFYVLHYIGWLYQKWSLKWIQVQFSRSVASDSFRPHELYSMPGLPVHPQLLEFTK